MPVGLRIAALLRLVALSDETERLSVRLQCAQAGCGDFFEIDLPLDALTAQAVDVPLRIELPAGRHVALRLPTGNDLRSWHTTPGVDRHAVIAALRIEGEVLADDAVVLGEAIAAHDPLVAFSVSCVCPACGFEDDFSVDLEGLALARFAMRQHGMLREVHVLASRYGWTEQEALAVPASRRAQYIALIEDALS